jgi:hypothetical protein
MLAREAKMKFFIAELSWNVFFLAVLLPAAAQGLEVAGIAYVTAYVLYACVSLILASRETAFVLSSSSRRVVAWVSLVVIATFVAAESSSDLGLSIALVLALACTVVAASRLFVWTRRAGTR